MGYAPIIAIIDDDHRVRSAMVMLLRSIGFETRTFSSAHEYLESNDERIDCIISDYRMDGISGVELHLRLRGSSPAKPFILMTAFWDARIQSEAEAAGIKTVFQKPFEAKSLITRLEGIFGSLDI